MRLDLFLKSSRLVLRRTLAQELCDAGAVRVNGHTAKSSRAVNVGDTIALRYRSHELTVRVLALPAGKQTSRHEATSLYEIISDVRLDHEN